MGGRLMLRWICKSSSPRQALCIISQAVHNATSATPQSWKSPSSLYYKSLENTNFEKQINNSTQLLWHDSITQHVLCMSSILHGGFQTISPQRLPIEQPQTHKAHHTSSRWQLHHLPIVHHPTSYSQKIAQNFSQFLKKLIFTVMPFENVRMRQCYVCCVNVYLTLKIKSNTPIF